MKFLAPSQFRLWHPKHEYFGPSYPTFDRAQSEMKLPRFHPDYDQHRVIELVTTMDVTGKGSAATRITSVRKLDGSMVDISSFQPPSSVQKFIVHNIRYDVSSATLNVLIRESHNREDYLPSMGSYDVDTSAHYNEGKVREHLRELIADDSGQTVLDFEYMTAVPSHLPISGNV